MDEQKRQLNMLHIFVTDRCNMRCPHCYVDSKGKFDDELTTEEIISLFKELNSLKFDEGIHLEGGEPFLRKDLTEFLPILNDLSQVTIATNGTIPFNEKFLAIKNIGRIGFSVEGATQETHNKLRPNDLSKLFDNIVTFQKAGFSVQTRTTLTSQNYQEILPLIAMNHERMIPIARFQAFTPVGRGAQNQNLSLNAKEYIQAIKNYLEAVRTYGKKVQIKFSMPTIVADKLNLNFIPKDIKIDKTICYKDCDQVAISAKGDVFQCYNLLDIPANKLGNIREKSFTEIVSSSKFYEKDICPNQSCASAGEGYTHLVNV